MKRRICACNGIPIECLAMTRRNNDEEDFRTFHRKLRESSRVYTSRLVYATTGQPLEKSRRLMPS
jgi:hypothetical protein